VICFGNKAAHLVLNYAFTLLKEVYLSDNILKGQQAIEWDI